MIENFKQLSECILTHYSNDKLTNHRRNSLVVMNYVSEVQYHTLYKVCSKKTPILVIIYQLV